MLTLTKMRNRMITSTNGIQSGDSTHHHDQSMTPESFRAMKTIVSRPMKPIPPELEFDSVDI
jgi:hypothetical protein